VTYPIKFLDYFLARNKFAFMIACSVYFVGRKPEAAISAPGENAALAKDRERVDAPSDASPTGAQGKFSRIRPIGAERRSD
jgi:hypothetical protein